MQPFLLLLTFIALTFVDSPSMPLIRTIPDTGSWAKYHASITMNDQEESLIYVLRAKGRETVNDKPCCWIEMESFRPLEGGKEERVVLYKLLIPEEEFGEDKNPLTRAVKIFVQYAEGDARQIDSLTDVDPALSIMLAGVQGKVTQRTEQETVKCQRGDLLCDIHTGESSHDLGAISAKIQHHIYLHETVPFQLAGFRQEYSGTLFGQPASAKVEVLLNDYGSSPATSEK